MIFTGEMRLGPIFLHFNLSLKFLQSNITHESTSYTGASEQLQSAYFLYSMTANSKFSLVAEWTFFKLLTLWVTFGRELFQFGDIEKLD